MAIHVRNLVSRPDPDLGLKKNRIWVRSEQQDPSKIKLFSQYALIKVIINYFDFYIERKKSTLNLNRSDPDPGCLRGSDPDPVFLKSGFFSVVEFNRGIRVKSNRSSNPDVHYCPFCADTLHRPN